jgi:hypothetical protein
MWSDGKMTYGSKIDEATQHPRTTVEVGLGKYLRADPA